MKISDRKLGNKKAISDTVKQIRTDIIKPDDTIDPIDFLSFCPE